MKDRREEARFAPPSRVEMRATLRPGCAVTLVEVSGRGARIHAPRPIRPGARVHLQVVMTARRVAVAGYVLRCMVWSLETGAGVIYQAALRFDHLVDWRWAEGTRRVQPMPEHSGPDGSANGKRLPENTPRWRLASRRG